MKKSNQENQENKKNLIFLLLSLIGMGVSIAIISMSFNHTEKDEKSPEVRENREENLIDSMSFKHIEKDEESPENPEENLIDFEYDSSSNESLMNNTYNDNNIVLEESDIIDAQNYIRNNVNDDFLNNIFMTVLDVNIWLFNNRNNDDLISENVEEVMLSTFCLASNVTPAQRSHLFNMMDLLIGYDPVLQAEYTQVVQKIQNDYNLPVPDKNKSDELCSVFEEYPSKDYKSFQVQMD